MRTKQLFTIYLILLGQFSFAQNLIKKEIEAIRISQTPTIDGYLNESLWDHVPIASDWTQMEPRNGEKERYSQRSELKFIYDDEALYIGAILYDHAPDSILTELTKRDELEKNNDWLGIWISPYNDGQNEYMFAVTAAGTQIDARLSVGNFDMNWDAVWKSEVQIHDKGWSIEMKIPYSALRFPKKDVQLWGINMGREIRRTRESYSWNPIDISMSNYSIQAGLLTGIENIKAPLRLSFMPYIASYLDLSEGESAHRINGGLDLKYGINESFTLDMTLIPDFGQTVFDDKILNVSPFEVRLDENRAFFTEGTELFNKSGLFYSRRIGEFKGFELDTTEVYLESPSAVKLLNASKISGRTNGGLGIGFFNALTENTYATVRDTISGEERSVFVEPLANYNVLVLDQSLSNNSFITFTNTNVLRKGEARDANVEKLQFQWANKENSYCLKGGLAMSHIFENQDTENGFSTNITFKKTSGNFRFKLRQNTKSDQYNINDLGYQQNNNHFNYSIGLEYHQFTPIGKLRKANISFQFEQKQIYKPRLYNESKIDLNMRVHFLNFFSSGLYLNYNPTSTYDYFEARTYDFDHVYRYGPMIGGYWWSSTDYSKRFATDFGIGYDVIPELNSKSISLRLSPRFRVNDHIFMTYVISQNVGTNDIGRAFDYAENLLEDEDENILFSKRNRYTLTNVYQVSYVINNKVSMGLKLRHYWSKLEHKKFFTLEDGDLFDSDFAVEDTEGNPLYNINYNTWNVDLNFVWRFAPGSELNFQWKNALDNLTDRTNLNYQQNLSRVFDESQLNSLSLKLIYYLDSQYLKRK